MRSLFGLFLLSVACSGSTADPGGTGGAETTESGGDTSTGGLPDASGGAAEETGGAESSGGARVTGGSSGGGAAQSGGAPSSGGRPVSGGSPGSGGSEPDLYESCEETADPFEYFDCTIVKFTCADERFDNGWNAGYRNVETDERYDYCPVTSCESLVTDCVCPSTPSACAD